MMMYDSFSATIDERQHMTDGKGQPRRATLKSIKRQRPLSETVAEALTEYIFDSGLRPGDRLPSERELGEKFGVSRTVIREAVRSLVGKGLIHSHTGTRLVVSTVEANSVGDLLNLVLRGHTLKEGGDSQVALWSLHEVRSTIEVEIAGLAAERATDKDINRMAAAAHKMDEATTDDARVLADEAFHNAIAVGTHNEFYLLILESLVTPLRKLRKATLELKTGVPDATSAHAKILSAIRARDKSGARTAMAKHIVESGRALEKIDRFARNGTMGS